LQKKANRQGAKDYEDWMLDAALKHIRDGWSLNCFTGRHNVNSQVWIKLMKTHPKLQIIKEEYKKIKALRKLKLKGEQ
jgi:hypothetical protein